MPKKPASTRKAFERTKFGADETRTFDVRVPQSDRIDKLHQAYPSRRDGVTRNQTVSRNDWLASIISTALPLWEAEVPKLLPKLLADLGRMPRPDELAAEIVNEHLIGWKQLDGPTPIDTGI